ncbi:MAG: hypothetical protein RMI91_15375, partial [Gemmatales bacterium]|nr:hypothetical protein [Gemmatales bacterium]MDW7996027.1 hypothetical protein [Gemmatales bacterium]
MNRRLVFVMDTDGKPEKLVVFNGNECYRVTQVSKDGNNTEAPYSIRSSFNALAENGSSNIELTLPAIMMFYQSFRSAH